MNKDALLLCAALAVLVGGGGYHFYASKHQPPPPDPLTAAKTALGSPGHAKPAAAPASAAQKQAASGDAARQQQIAAARAAHAQIETALGSLKVSSILLGDPAIIIVSKKEYSVGDALVLPDGKTLRVTGIGEDGVALAGNGEAFHLAAPAAPDLAASRKK